MKGLKSKGKQKLQRHDLHLSFSKVRSDHDCTRCLALAEGIRSVLQMCSNSCIGNNSAIIILGEHKTALTLTNTAPSNGSGQQT